MLSCEQDAKRYLLALAARTKSSPTTQTTSATKRSYCPHRPTDRQRAFLALDCREAFYGGAAGGGKSDALLMAAMQYVKVPGYAALILRRTFRDLNQADAIMDRAKNWLAGTDAVWNGNDKRFTFPSGATITFGYLEHEDDVYQYQGAAFQFVGFDELTQFSEKQYLYLHSRIRRGASSEVPLRVRSASNPGGRGHEWVKSRFVDPGHVDRPYISARLADNPHLDQSTYLEQLQQLDHITRAQLLDGNWDVLPEGDLFKREWFRVVDSSPGGRRARFWDLAATAAKSGKDPDWTAGVLLCAHGDGTYTIEDVTRLRGTPSQVERIIAKVAEIDGRGTMIYIEEEGGASGKFVSEHFVRHVLAGYPVRPRKSTGPKPEYIRPLSSAFENGLIALRRGAWNHEFVNELCAYPSDGVHDDQADAAAKCYAALARPKFSIVSSS